MKNCKISIITAGILLSLMLSHFEGKSQLLYIGINGGTNYTWFRIPESNEKIRSSGKGGNVGFFLRYGKRPYYMAGFDWSHSSNNFVFNNSANNTTIEDQISYHNFEFSLKAGYEIIQKPYFKWYVHGGPFIGRSLLFHSNNFELSNSDFKNPQYGVVAGTGIQVTNFILTIEYSYHISGLFKPIYLNGNQIDFGSRLQMLSIKAGMQF